MARDCVSLSRRGLRGASSILALPGVARAPMRAGGDALIIATTAGATSLDPHFHEHDPSITAHRQVFEFPTGQGPRAEQRPELATSWRARDPLTSEFTRPTGLLWDDGSAFTGEDVLASFRRIPQVPNSPSSFALYVRQITEAVAEDPLTLVFRTAAPFPLMPNYMGAVMIVPAAQEQASTQDFNTMRATIGTGPYRIGEYARGQRIVLEANPRHLARAPAFQRVTVRPITANGPRGAAHQGGGADRPATAGRYAPPSRHIDNAVGRECGQAHRRFRLQPASRHGTRRHRAGCQPDPQPLPRPAGAAGDVVGHQPRRHLPPGHGRHGDAAQPVLRSRRVRPCTRHPAPCLRPRPYAPAAGRGRAGGGFPPADPRHQRPPDE